MSALLSVRLWLILLGRILKASHPLTFGLAMYQLWVARSRWRALVVDSGVRLFFLFLVADLAIRALMFFGGVKYQTRYFLTLTVCLVVLAGMGAVNLSGALEPWLARIRRPRLPGSLVIVLTVIFLFNAGKALIPRLDSPWFVEIPKAIKASCPEDGKPVLISMIPDPRYAYYAGADYLQFSKEQNQSPGAVMFLSDASGTVTRLGKKELGDGVQLARGMSIVALFPIPPVVGRVEFEQPPEASAKYVIHCIPQRRGGGLAGVMGNDAPPPESALWRKVFEGESTWASIPLCQYKCIKLTRIDDGPPLTIKEFKTYKTPPFTICEMDLDKTDYWNPWSRAAGTVAGMEHFNENVRKLGGRRVFVLSFLDDDSLRTLMSDRKNPFQLSLLKSYRDNNRRPICLYQCD